MSNLEKLAKEWENLEKETRRYPNRNHKKRKEIEQKMKILQKKIFSLRAALIKKNMF